MIFWKKFIALQHISWATFPTHYGVSSEPQGGSCRLWLDCCLVHTPHHSHANQRGVGENPEHTDSRSNHGCSILPIQVSLLPGGPRIQPTSFTTHTSASHTDVISVNPVTIGTLSYGWPCSCHPLYHLLLEVSWFQTYHNPLGCWIK